MNICGFFTSLHIPLSSSEALGEEGGVAHSHDHQSEFPNCTEGTRVFRGSLLSFCSNLVLAPPFWHDTWKPQENPLRLGAVQLSAPRTCIQMWAHQLCRTRSTVQGSGRQELLPLPLTKYLPALVLG